jgi:hypothetical protein
MMAQGYWRGIIPTISTTTYDSDMGHWVLLKCDPANHDLYIFDSYGNKPDGAWPYLLNTKALPEPKHILTSIIFRYAHGDINYSITLIIFKVT